MSKCTALELKYPNNTLYASVIQGDDEVILVDCGYPNSLNKIDEALKAFDLSLDQITHLIITHHDYDHMGSAAELKRRFPKIKVCSSSVQRDYINGSKKSLRLIQAESIFPTLQDNQKEQALIFHKTLEAMETLDLDEVLIEDTDYPWAGGTHIVASPGHIPGHISVYHKPTQSLITGDAMVVENGKLCIANPRYTLDNEQAYASMKKFNDYPLEQIICYHGGLVSENIKDQLNAL